MGTIRHPIIEKSILEDLYLNKKLGLKRIAKEIGVSQTTIKRDMDYHNIPIRSREEALGHIEIPKETLEELYVHQCKTLDEIAALYGITKNCVRQYCVNANIPMRQKGRPSVLCKRKRKRTKSSLVSISKNNKEKAPLIEHKETYEVIKQKNVKPKKKNLTYEQGIKALMDAIGF